MARDDLFVENSDLREDVELVAGEVTENDLSNINAAAIRSLTVVPTDWTVEVLATQIAKKRIELSPDFQRRVAWNATKMSRFIESLFLRLPVPQIVLAEVAPGKFIVIDGKQRLMSLARFLGVFDEKLRLTGCEYLIELNGKTIDDLRGDQQLSAALDSFESHTMRTVVLQKWGSEDMLYLLFLRLNQNGVTLSPQELRRALHPGPFLDWLDEWTSNCDELHSIFTYVPDFRMRDMEVVTRHLAFALYASSYDGNMKKFLDVASGELNANWQRSLPVVEKELAEFVQALASTTSVFGEEAFKTFVDGRYQRSPNRAVIDIMCHSLNSREVRKAVEAKKVEVRTAFERLCTENTRFLRYLQSTTKSREATFGRFSIWSEALSEILGQNVPMPAVKA